MKIPKKVAPRPKGTLYFGALVNCGKCGSRMDVLPVSAKTSQEILAHIRGRHWKETRKYGWTCETCVATLNRESAAAKKTGSGRGDRRFPNLGKFHPYTSSVF